MIPLSFAITVEKTPVFNNPDLSPLPPDSQGLCRGLETILYPRSVVHIEEISGHVARITTDEYPYEGMYYLDCSLLKPAKEPLSPRYCPLPSLPQFLDRLAQLEGTRYTWGGCFPESGVDCSGLIRYATGGGTPHRTSSLVHWGSAVAIEELPWEPQVRPGDLIVWVGHVVAVLDREHILESLPQKGVVATSLETFMKRLLKERRALNRWPTNTPDQPSFVIRRFLTEEVPLFPEHNEKLPIEPLCR